MGRTPIINCLWRGLGGWVLLVALTFPVAGRGRAVAEDGLDRGALIRKQRQLERQIAVLEQERDLLLFRRVLQQSDSKYLLLDLARKTGTLKYRSRVLRTFRLSSTKGPKGRLRPGPVVLTEKRDRHGKGRTLLFGRHLVLQGRGEKRSKDPGQHYALGQKDLAALTYALEEGAFAYIVAP